MNLRHEITQSLPEMTKWRHDIHAHPELAYQESRTANLVASRLESFGIEVHRGLGGTGVVGTLRRGQTNRGVGLRADMDALPMQELNTFSHRSSFSGRMHGCGHDGHTVMLLGAAEFLAKHGDFDGVVYFIFQPAEEANEKGSGALAMIQDGLFERFPMDSVFAMHNWPGLAVGKCNIRSGPALAAIDLFEVTVTGHGTHGAMPHTGIDTMLVCAHLISAWQSIVSRNINPLEQAVISATTIQVDDSWTIIPEVAVIKGSIRTFNMQTEKKVKERMISIAENLAAAMGANAEVTFRPVCPATVNDQEMAASATAVAEEILGANNVFSASDAFQVMGSEDFSYMLQKKPGAYLFFGNGDGAGGCMIHEPRYDFNDELLPVGASFWANLVENILNP